MISRNYPNGITTTYEYDNMSRLKRLKDVNSTATLFDRDYSYNSASQIQQISEPTNTRTFGYDLVDRLKTVTASSSQNESYNFDDVGNRASSHKSANYGYQPFNKLVSTATASYSYDANANLVRKSEGGKFWRFNWDYENRLTMASTRKQTVRYIYDALGRRVQRHLVGNKENTKFIYDGFDVLVDDNSGVLTKYLNSEGIDNKLRVQTGSDVKYFLADHLGSTNGLADSSGNLTASNSYDSFGNVTNTTFPTRYQFTGREYDNFTGLHYYRARFYDANLGRFISEDPIGFAGNDVNLFGYVKNNPINFKDPKGTIPLVVGVIILAELGLHSYLYFIDAPSRFPLEVDRQGRKKHCYINCVSVRVHLPIAAPVLGHGVASLLSIGNEVPTLIGTAINGGFQNELSESAGDLKANAYGQYSAYSIWKSCEELCKECQ